MATLKNVSSLLKLLFYMSILKSIEGQNMSDQECESYCSIFIKLILFISQMTILILAVFTVYEISKS